MKQKFFSLTWRKLWIIVVSGFILILLHNAIACVWGIEESVTIIIIGLLVLYFLISGIVSLVWRFKKKKFKR